MVVPAVIVAAYALAKAQKVRAMLEALLVDRWLLDIRTTCVVVRRPNIAFSSLAKALLDTHGGPDPYDSVQSKREDSRRCYRPTATRAGRTQQWSVVVPRRTLLTEARCLRVFVKVNVR